MNGGVRPGEEESPTTIDTKLPPRAKKRRFAPIKIANQIPMRRRKEIEKALGEAQVRPNGLEKREIRIIFSLEKESSPVQ